MFKLAIEVCFENHFGLIHAIFLSLGSTKSGYFFLGHPVYAGIYCTQKCAITRNSKNLISSGTQINPVIHDSQKNQMVCDKIKKY